MIIIKKITTLIIPITVAFFALILTSCNTTQNDNYTTVSETTSIYFENGSIKNYDYQSEIDPFKDIEITFSGTPNNGTAIINTDNCPDIIKDNFTFECVNNGSLSNGKTAIIKAYFEESAFEKAGYKIKRTEKLYTVTDVDFYPTAIKNYEKDALNKAMWDIVSNYIESNIESLDMVYDSGFDRSGWSISGSFKYTYNYSDLKMIYNVNKNNPSQNTYSILYELSNDIECIEDMEEIYENSMKSGDFDTGRTYVVASVKGITATSDKIFNSNIDEEDIISDIKIFDTKAEAEEYFKFDGDYITQTENFV